MILLITYGLFHLNLNLTPSLHCPTSLLMLLLNSTVPSKPSSVTTDVSLTTLPPGPFCQKGHNSGCRVLTRPLIMVKKNVSFAPLTMLFARCLFKLSFLNAIGLKSFTLPHIYSIVFCQRRFRLSVRTLPSSTLLHHTSICASSTAHVTLTLPPPRPTNSPLGPPGMSFLATPLIIKAIIALISPQTA
jgi:hypothetical protein